MYLFRKIPFTWKGQLHDVRLINFSVPLHEVEENVPAEIKIRLIGGRALISMVDVKLKKMRLSGMPELCSFSYRHLAFRLLVDDGSKNEGACKGVFFLKSFSDKALVVAGAGVFTNYRLSKALIFERANMVTVDQGPRHIRYSLDSAENENLPLKKIVCELDRAYCIDGKDLLVTQIMREKWPLMEYSCSEFYTNFFKDVRFEGAFKVPEVIDYTWLSPKKLQL